jgi:hypothetical protein
MNARDEFTERTKQALALRAGHRCSLPDCGRGTVGPSDESVDATAVVGQAAHICAASPGGPRSNPKMTPEERRDITNGIWLCATHATFVDRDTAKYTALDLRKIKADHEQRVKQELAGGGGKSNAAGQELDLIQIGPDVVGTGVLESGSMDSWTIRIEHFVRGDLNELLRYADGFDGHSPPRRFVLANELGEGRVLRGPPTWQRGPTGIRVDLPVVPRPPGRPAASLGKTLAVGFDGDLVYENHSLKMVSGLDAVPQKLYISMSTQLGEDPLHPAFGSRASEYHGLFRDTRWLGRLVQLEVIRLASIPQGEAHAPLDFIERVRAARIEDHEIRNQRLTVVLDVDVVGLGRREYAIPIVIPGAGRKHDRA